MKIKISGVDLGQLLKKANQPVGGVVAVSDEDGWTVKYNEPRQVYVVAFGHIHFKDCCKNHGINWEDCHYVVNTTDLKNIDPKNALILWHPTASNRCDYYYLRELNTAFGLPQ